MAGRLGARARARIGPPRRPPPRAPSRRQAGARGADATRPPSLRVRYRGAEPSRPSREVPLKRVQAIYPIEQVHRLPGSWLRRASPLSLPPSSLVANPSPTANHTHPGSEQQSNAADKSSSSIAQHLSTTYIHQ